MQPLSSECKVKTFSCRLHEIIVSFSRKIPKYGVFFNHNKVLQQMQKLCMIIRHGNKYDSF